MTPEEKPYDKYLKELPPVVRDIVLRAKVPEKLRALAKEYQLHLDKWAALENEIMLALVGVKPSELLAQNIQQAIDVDTATARAMTDDIAKLVFRPIRESLEDALDGGKKRAVETLTRAPQQQVIPQEPRTYAPGVKSSERETIHDDPYREPLE